jgi:hypothetical protein
MGMNSVMLKQLGAIVFLFLALAFLLTLVIKSVDYRITNENKSYASVLKRGFLVAKIAIGPQFFLSPYATKLPIFYV